jgi:hypothetical protein
LKLSIWRSKRCSGIGQSTRTLSKVLAFDLPRLGSVSPQEDNGAVSSPTRSGLFHLLFVVALSFSVPIARAQETVSLIEIHSGWGGLGTSQNAELVIRSKDGAFFS